MRLYGDQAQQVARPGVQFHLATDASDTGTGGVIFQMEDTEAEPTTMDSNLDKVRIIMWLSHKLGDAERRDSMQEKEIPAIVVGLKKTKWLVDESPYALKVSTVIAHKENIDSMANLSEVHGKVARWIGIRLDSYRAKP
ncbi:hypothetical protein E4U61_000388 [Claviceps capensis]|nr:hypothetical protein E4U61_000388 [Claviceps capensis]